MTAPTESLAPDPVQLLPCPFCGGAAEFERKGTARQSCIVSCQSCGCRLETNEVWSSGERWNDRHTGGDLPEPVNSAEVRKVLGAFYKTVDVMKSARNQPNHIMHVWADDMKAVEDVMFFLENLRDSGAPQPRGESAQTNATQPVGSPNSYDVRYHENVLDQLQPRVPDSSALAGPVSKDELARVLWEAEYDGEAYPWATRTSGEKLTYLQQAGAALHAFTIRPLYAAPQPDREADVIETIRNEWGSHLCYRDSFGKRQCGLDNEGMGCRCRDIARALASPVSRSHQPIGGDDAK